ncbi:MAG TPA: SRPBCC family protein [Rhizomicrobium sp.]|jgi:uncharacterized protein YndB with AHSA1/START domain|nr:SRPBCC family protein [Rhizomicrobium sp.]
MNPLGTVSRTFDGGTILLYERLIDKAPAQVWAMLTEPALLQRWLERAEVDLRLGGAFVLHFPNGAMRGVIRALEPERLLEYSWGENDTAPPSVVRWILSPQDGRTKLKLMHVLPPGTPDGEAVELGGGWHVILDRLGRGGGSEDKAALRESEARYAGLFREAATLVRDGALEKRDDGFVVRFERLIPRPPARVWTALTEPNVLANWLGAAEVEPRQGGKFVFRFHDADTVMTGSITAFEPERVLEYSWVESGVDMPPSHVRWELAAADEGCRLVLTHRFAHGVARRDIVPFLGGWEGLLDVLAEASDGRFMPYRAWEPYDALYREAHP